MKKRHLILAVICLIMVLLNITARLGTAFPDFYLKYIFHYISVPFSFITGLVPFSVGEFLIYCGIALVVIGIPLLVLLVIFRKNSRRKICSIGASAALWVAAFVVTTETLNCFIMYQCTKFSDRYFPDTHEHTDEELTELYALLIDKCNELSLQVSRDENGQFVLTDELIGNAKAAMKKAAEDYSVLSGYYPDPKPIFYSYYMAQSDLLGIFFPFSMEANYNADMCDINFPNTICHEYSHLKGIIQEDEANFIAFIATTGSDSIDFRYSGYINALEYVQNQIYENNVEQAFSLDEKIEYAVVCDLFRFMPENYIEENDDMEIISTETVEVFSDAATDTSLKINGVEDGIKSYSRMVNLLLDYYF